MRTQPTSTTGSGTDRPDAVVIGGGVAGLGVAWRAAQQGLRVTVVDDRPGLGASHAAAGMLAPVTEVTYGEEALLALSLESARRWTTFAGELEEAAGVDPGYRPAGTLVVALDADDHRLLLELVSFQEELGLEVDRLRSRECRELEPALAPRIRGGLLVAGDHQVDNRAATEALLAAAEAAGVVVRRERATGIDVAGVRVRGVTLAGGDRIHTGTVVVAAGAWSSQLDGLPDEVRPPVRPVKGQILRLRDPDGQPLVGRTVRGYVEGRHVYVVPRTGGRVVVGGTVEERGYDTAVTAGAVRDLLDDAFALVPGVTELELEESTAGLRPGTPDNAPILGPTAIEGLVMATGHYRNGFLLLPVTADEIGHLLATGEVSDTIAPFSLSRFAGEHAAVGS